jgi:hypothetical protein
VRSSVHHLAITPSTNRGDIDRFSTVLLSLERSIVAIAAITIVNAIGPGAGGRFSR